MARQQMATSSPYKFNSEEMKVLEQCNKESFYQRCLPFGTCFGVVTYLGVRSGTLMPNPKLGAIPKVSVAVILGYILGKISYQKKCAEKLMALPNSKLGAMLRNRQGGFIESLTLDVQEPESVKSLSPSEKYDDTPHTATYMDLDVDRPPLDGLDDSFRPTVDGTNLPKNREDEPIARPGSSYDDLRRMNREEYLQKRTQPYRGLLSADDVPTALKTRDGVSPLSEPQPREDDVWSKPPPRKQPTNKYGDIFEK